MASSAVLADEGVKAVTAGKYPEGIEKLSKALEERPAPLWLLERSKAYLRTNELDLALYDAEKALLVAYERANRDQMAEAQIRRAITLFRIGRYADADVVAFWAGRLLNKAKATENDGQQEKVDKDGEYTVRLADFTAETYKPSKDRGLAAAVNSNAERSKNNNLRNQANLWRFKALTELEKLPSGHPGRKVNALEKYPKPSNRPISKAEKKTSATDTTSDGNDLDTQTDQATAEKSEPSTWKSVWEQFVECYATHSIRSSLYQTDATLNADFFVKNVPSGTFTVTATDQKVVMGPIPAPRPESVQLHLWGKIRPEETKYTVKSMKIELVLKKDTPGKWPKLEQDFAFGFNNVAGPTVVKPSLDQFITFVSRLGYNHPDELGLPDFEADKNGWYSAILDAFQAHLDESKVSAATSSSGIPIAVTSDTSISQSANVPTQPTSQASNPTVQPVPTVSKPSSAKTDGSAGTYPTSSKKGAVNWDKIADVDEDDEDDESKNGDVNSFFQKLYQDADPDTKRAMMKSYVESNGTSLSTSWSEAKEKTYKTQPPDGAEAKKWD